MLCNLKLGQSDEVAFYELHIFVIIHWHFITICRVRSQTNSNILAGILFGNKAAFQTNSNSIFWKRKIFSFRTARKIDQSFLKETHPAKKTHKTSSAREN